MTNLMTEKLDKMYVLLSEQKFKFSDNIDTFKCILCRNILINACQTVCGCNFCHKCIDEYIIHGGNICPGNTNECKMDNLKRFSTNHRINMQISKLIVKCPNEMCSHECHLIDIEEHLRFCSKKSVKCPFYDLGCDYDKVENDKLDEHLQSENLCHNKLMIDMIIHLKNEVLELRQNEIQMNSEIKILKENEKKKDEEIQSLQKENKRLEQNFQSILHIYEYNLDSIDEKENPKSINNSTEIVNEDNKTASQILDQSIGKEKKDLDDSINMQMEARFFDLKQNWKQKLEQKISEKVNAYKKEVETRLEELVKCINMKDEIFEWRIDKIIGIRKNENIVSDFFYQRMNPYKMRLKLKIQINFLWIRLRIYSGISDAYRKWPFHADVTVKISNKDCPDACRIITQMCKINKPFTNSYKSSDRFTFYNSELASVGLMNDIDCIVECLVKFE